MIPANYLNGEPFGLAVLLYSGMVWCSLQVNAYLLLLTFDR